MPVNSAFSDHCSLIGFPDLRNVDSFILPQAGFLLYGNDLSTVVMVVMVVFTIRMTSVYLSC